MVIRLLLCTTAYIIADSHNAHADQGSDKRQTDSNFKNYIPEMYSEYVPDMGNGGFRYQKYMQGQPNAMKFQQKVLPQGNYQQYIPLSQEQSKDSEAASAVVLASTKGEKKEESKESKSANKDSHDEETGLDLERYMQQPSPGPVVNKKYGKYIPSKYRDYVPEMDESGIKYQKYMQGQPNAHTPESSIFEIELDKEPLRDRSEQLLRTTGIIAMLAAASVLAFAFRRQRSAPVGLQQPLTANADGPFINQSV